MPAVEIVSLAGKLRCKLRAGCSAKRDCFSGSKFAGVRVAARQSINQFTPAPKWPGVNQEQREAIIRDGGGGLVDLWEASPVRIEDNESHTEALIDRLFPGDPLLCCGLLQFEFRNSFQNGMARTIKRAAIYRAEPDDGAERTDKGGQTIRTRAFNHRSASVSGDRTGLRNN